MKKLTGVLCMVLVCAMLLGNVALAETTEISILHRWSGSDPMTSFFEAFNAAFEERHPDIKVNNLSVNEEAAYNNKFKTLVATGDMPSIFYLPGIASLVKYAENGLIMDVREILDADPEWAATFLDGVFDMFDFAPYGIEGIYSIPNAVAPEAIFYNVETLQSLGYETFPETQGEWYAMMDKMLEADIVPIAPGAKETWRTGHIHNNFLYKWCGTDKAMQLGSRDAKWTDEDVVQSLAYVKEMYDKGYLMENCTGITVDMEKELFMSGEVPMMINGSWSLGDFKGRDLPFTVGVAAFPYFEEKPEFKGHGVSYPQNLVLSGTMEEAEKAAAILWIKEFLSVENVNEIVKQVGILPPLKGLDYDALGVSDQFKQCMTAMENGTSLAGDSFDYDQLSSMQDVTRNAIIGMIMGNSPEQAAQEIQDEIDYNA